MEEQSYPWIKSEGAKLRSTFTIGEKQAIIKEYKKIPWFVTETKKAEQLGLKRNTLRNILEKRKEIMTHKYSHHIKRNSTCKERKVAEKTFEWIQSAREKNEKISIPIILRKATEIAVDMGKDFTPSRGWLQRLLQRYDLNMTKINGLATT